jgi:hypothetical protein
VGTIRVATWAFVLVVGLVTAYLAWLNRGSDKITTNLPTALAVGLVGTLLTLLFSLQSEEKTYSVALEYVIDPATRRPLVCHAFPDSIEYCDAGATTTFPAWRMVSEIDKINAATMTDDPALQRLYRLVLLRQILNVLRFT